MTRYILRIDAADQERANRAALAWDPEGGGHTFPDSLALVDPHTLEPVYIMRRMLISDPVHAALVQMRDEGMTVELPDGTEEYFHFPTALIIPWDMDADLGLPERLMEEWGVVPRPTEEDGDA